MGRGRVGGGSGCCERRIEVIQKISGGVGGEGSGGGSGLCGGQGGCERNVGGRG